MDIVMIVLATLYSAAVLVTVGAMIKRYRRRGPKMVYHYCQYEGTLSLELGSQCWACGMWIK